MPDDTTPAASPAEQAQAAPPAPAAEAAVSTPEPTAAGVPSPASESFTTPPPPAPTAGEPTSGIDVDALLAGVGDVNAFLKLTEGIPPQKESTAPDATPAPTPAPETPAAAPEAPVDPAPEPPAEADPSPTGEIEQDRFRFQDQRSRKVAATAKALGCDLVQAADIVRQQEAKAPDNAAPVDPAAQATTTTPPAPAVRSPADVQADIDALDSREDEALTAIRLEELPDIRKQQRALQRELAQAERHEEESSRQDARRFRETVSQSEQRAVERYPDVQNANSALVQEMQRLDAQLQQEGDPLFNHPDKPFRLTAMAASNLGLAPRAPASPAASVPAPVPAPKASPSPTPTPRAATVPPVRPPAPAPGGARTSAAPSPGAVQEQAQRTLDSVKSERDFLTLVNGI